MGVLSRLGKKLRILGSGSPERPIRSQPASTPAPYTPPEPEVSPRGDQDAAAYIAATVKDHPVVLFMKGSPMQPLCGFSANAAGILSSYGLPLHTVDVIADPEVRDAVKEFSSWPTLPQTYIHGEFVGGSDILTQLHESGDLKEMMSASPEG